MHLTKVAGFFWFPRLRYDSYQISITWGNRFLSKTRKNEDPIRLFFAKADRMYPIGEYRPVGFDGGSPIDDIPKGDYCYIYTEEGFLDEGAYQRCPFWDKDLGRPAQENGFCHFMNQGDWQVPGVGLLWDQVKECGKNPGDDWVE